MNFGIDDLGSELFRQIRDAGGDRAPRVPFRAGPARAHAQHRRGGCHQALSRHYECVLAVADKRIAPAAAEGPAAAQEERGLKKAGFARGVRANEEINGWIEFQLDT